MKDLLILIRRDLKESYNTYYNLLDKKDLTIFSSLYSKSFDFDNCKTLDYSFRGNLLKSEIYHHFKGLDFLDKSVLDFNITYPLIDKNSDKYIAILSDYDFDVNMLKELNRQITFGYNYFSTFVYFNPDNFNVCHTGYVGKQNLVLFNIKSLIVALGYKLPDDDYLRGYFSNNAFSVQPIASLIFDLVDCLQSNRINRNLQIIFNGTFRDEGVSDVKKILKTFVTYTLLQSYQVLYMMYDISDSYDSYCFLSDGWKYLPILLINPNYKEKQLSSRLIYSLYTMFNSAGKRREIESVLLNQSQLKDFVNSNEFLIDFVNSSITEFVDNVKFLSKQEYNLLTCMDDEEIYLYRFSDSPELTLFSDKNNFVFGC